MCIIYSFYSFLFSSFCSHWKFEWCLFLFQIKRHMGTGQPNGLLMQETPLRDYLFFLVFLILLALEIWLVLVFIPNQTPHGHWAAWWASDAGDTASGHPSFHRPWPGIPVGGGLPRWGGHVWGGVGWGCSCDTPRGSCCLRPNRCWSKGSTTMMHLMQIMQIMIYRSIMQIIQRMNIRQEIPSNWKKKM